MKGRKRHILVDVEGFVLPVLFHAADIQERAGAKLLLEQLSFPAARLKLIWADAGYWGRDFGGWMQPRRGDFHAKQKPDADQTRLRLFR